MLNSKIQIKGVREGLLIVLGDGAWDEVRQDLMTHLDQQAEFMRGAKIALDVGSQVLKAVELGKLRDELSERGMSLWAVVSQSATTELTAQSLGLATRLHKAPAERAMPPLETTLHKGEEAILVRRTLRSGFSLQHRGHIVVVGDVNPGAEIIAGGDVFVWGRLRGMVHAGAEGNEAAVVCALDLSPTQLRIAGKIALSPERRGKTQPEMARILNGQVASEAWNPKER
jgi:septum site-determining protein MinC